MFVFGKELCFQNGEPWRAQSLLGGTVSQLRPDGNGEGTPSVVHVDEAPLTFLGVALF